MIIYQFIDKIIYFNSTQRSPVCGTKNGKTRLVGNFDLLILACVGYWARANFRLMTKLP